MKDNTITNPTVPPIHARAFTRRFNASTLQRFNALTLPPLLALALSLVLGLSSHAATLTVTNNANSGAGSLRDTIAAATSGDTITFAASLAGQTIVLTTGEILLNKNLTIDGSALTNRILLNGNHASRIFNVQTNKTVLLNQLIITNALYSAAGGFGGGIYTEGFLTVSNCTLTGNSASSGGGGAIHNEGNTLTVNNCTFQSNTTSGEGGAISDHGPLVVNNSTFVSGSANAGGAIRIITVGNGDPTSIAKVNNCTFVTNSASFGADIYYYQSTLNLTNSIISSNTLASGGGILNSGSNLVGVNAQLSPLGNYGGPTQTMPPLPGSPAVDAGSDAVTSFLATDQRGSNRLSGVHVDIGAVELAVSAPSVTTSAATAVTSNGAMLNGSVNPGSLAATWRFLYGLTTSYGSSTVLSNLAAGSSTVVVSNGISGLLPGTTYHYTLVASNSVGTNASTDLTLTTAAAAPVAVTVAATSVTASSATLNGTVNPGGAPTGYYFQYGTNTSYGSSTFISNVVAGTSTVAVSNGISGLLPATTYHYSLVASNSAGTNAGTDLTFTTPAAAPTPVTVAASSVTTNSATLNGTVNPGGAATSYYFEYGTNTSYGSSTAPGNLAPGSSPVAVSNAISGLLSATLYHFRLVAWNSVGTNAGSDLTFTTPAPPPIVTAVNPNTGRGGGGTVVTISGANFTGATGVSFGGTGASFSVSNDTTITATTPPHAMGTVSVAVTTALGGTGTGTNLFSYTAIGSLATRRAFHTATLLPSGKVLVVGGTSDGSGALASAEIYDPATGLWSGTGSLNAARHSHAAVLLPNGKVLVVGGTVTDASALASAEIYDPATGSWSTTGSLADARYHHTLTLLRSGQLLVAGGTTDGTGGLASAEVYDPAAGTWANAGALNVARYSHTATLLPSGKVLVAGGQDTPSALASAELYDPATGTWANTGPLNVAVSSHTATLLTNGKVLVAGGIQSGPLVVVEIYDPATGTWSNVPGLNSPRASHTATLLPNGKVLVAGGTGGGPNTTELYDPASGLWASSSPLATGRYLHTATLLPSGKVLLAGGFNGSYLASAEIYEQAASAWSGTGSLAAGRYYHSATLLTNGKVLVAGGTTNNGTSSGLASVQLYDPAAGTWANTGSLITGRFSHTATLLPSGKVLVVGGLNNVSGYLASAELYDPATGTWSNTGSLVAARYLHTATLLPSGKVLVVGGFSSVNGYLTSAQLYDPATGTWANTGSLSIARYIHTATLLPNGKVLVAGGFGLSGYLSSAELYDPATGTWANTGSLTTGRAYHTATLLPNEKVLVAGGRNGGVNYLASTELYDPATGTWSLSGALTTLRGLHTATLLPNGKVLLSGGFSGSGELSSAELYDPATGTSSGTSSLLAVRYVHTATLLPNGKVLVVGGFGVSTYLASAELYDVGLGFNAAWQPQVASASFDAYGRLLLSGTRFLGVSTASGGNGSQDSPTGYPIVQLRRLDNEQSVFVQRDPFSGVSSNSFNSASGLPTFGQGYVTVTVFANGIPSASFLLLWTPSAAAPGILVEQPVGTGFTNGGSRSFTVTANSPGSLTFTIKNPGSLDLTGLTLTTDGPNGTNFIVTSSPTSPVVPGGSTTFTIQFPLTTSGTKTGAVHIANNVSGSNPFDINLTGLSLFYNTDTDDDGMSDGSEFDLAALGFNWQASQPALVATYYATATANAAGLYNQTQYNANLTNGIVIGQGNVTNNPNAYGLYTSNQIQALNVDAPLLTKNPDGTFLLTIGVQKATNLALPFLDFPMAATNTVINGQGKLEFQFTSPDNAAFFRLQAQ
jgi:N-acetylneuraminic acid mutarotase